MSSFFTLPKSQKKRKRDGEASAKTAKRSKPVNAERRNPRQQRDESISGSEDDGETRGDADKVVDEDEFSSEDETAAERRLRLAEQYLENIKGEVQEQVGFDAEEIDRDLIAERLEEDVAESKGKLHRFIATDYDYTRSIQTHFRMKGTSIYGTASCPPYLYTVSRDAVLTKWQIPDGAVTNDKAKDMPSKSSKAPRKPKQSRRRPIAIANTGSQKGIDKSLRHKGPILAVATSADGKYVVTGGRDKKIILYTTSAPEELTPIKAFSQHRDIVTSLCFRPGTTQFFSASRDRTVKVWAAEERAYVETLFGHQDEVTDVAAFPTLERCASVGARDRTARVWKVVDETQLVFRGGGMGGKKDQKGALHGEDEQKRYAEGSIDRVAIVDNETFVTGSDNGNLSLWGLQKKKPLFTYPLAHGLDKAMDPSEFSAELHLGSDLKLPERQPRWITALKVLPLSNLLITGSWDGQLRVWKIGESKKAIEPVCTLGSGVDSLPEQANLRGVVNGIEIFERGERNHESLHIVAAVGREHRLGRWSRLGSRGGAVVWEIPRKSLPVEDDQVIVNGVDKRGV